MGVSYGAPENPDEFVRIDYVVHLLSPSVGNAAQFIHLLRLEAFPWMEEQNVTCHWLIDIHDLKMPIAFWFAEDRHAVEFKLRWL